MSASLKLTANELICLSDALKTMTETARLSHVHFDLGYVDVSVNGSAAIRIAWDDDHNAYVVDDLIGD